MHADTDPSGNLVVSNSETWLLALAIVIAAGAVAVWFGTAPLRATIGWSLALFVIALLFYSAWERSVFVFDRADSVLIWRRVKPFSRAGGRVPFADITSLSLQQDFATNGQRSNARRLVIHTTTGVVPITTSFEAETKRHEAIAERIIAALHDAVPQAPLIALYE